MKTLQLSLIIFIAIIFLSFELQPVHADYTNGISIQNIKVQPSAVKVGDTFTVTATLVNNSTFPIMLEGGTCVPIIEHVPFFTIIFDNHTTTKSKNINCAGVGVSQILNSGKNLVGTSPDSTLDYIATKSGTANVTVTFSYYVKNQTDPTQPNIEQTISKSLLFTISDNNTGIKTVPEIVLSPLKQFKSGIAANDVKCKQDLQLLIKSEDDSPACVKQQTAQKLVERGWGWAMRTIDSIKPLLPYRIIGFENDTGIVTLRNQTYYFETPNYTDTAYSNPIQISFHDVIFTLFPPGFKGGLPTGIGCGNITAGEIVTGSARYYWTDAKFSDGTHELLHIFAVSPPCPEHPMPTYLSNHTNPQAGLTFYDGKMKLLVNTNNPKLSYMNIKVYSSYTPGSLVDHFLTGNLYSATGPIQNGNITIAVNGLAMGTTETYPSGCFQFNNWNDSKLVDQINKLRSLGNSFTELNFQTLYFGDSNHNPVNASADSSLQFYAVPLAPAQYDTSLSPSSEINVTQGSSAKLQVTIKPFSKYWEVQHMKLGLQRTPCGITYDMSPAENNSDSVLENHPGSFNVTLATSNYTPAGRYWIAITQDTSGLDNSSIDANVGAFFLNVMRK